MKQKKILSLLLVVAMLVGMLSSLATLAQAAVGDTQNVTYGTLNPQKSVSLPVTIHNYPNDGMLFEYASNTYKDQYRYARAHAELVTPAYGKAWYADGDRPITKTLGSGTERFSNLGTFYLAAYPSVNGNTGSPYYFIGADSDAYNADLKLYSGDYAAVSDAAKRWTVLMDADGYYTFINELTGSAMDIDLTDQSINVHCYTANGGGNQRWTAIANGDGSYVFRTVYTVSHNPDLTGRVLDLNGGTLANGQNIQAWTSNDSAAQKWFLIPANGSETALTGLAGDALRVIRTTSDVSSTVGAYATILEQVLGKENTRYMTLVYHVDTDASDISRFAPFKIVPIDGEHGYALDVSNGTATDGQKIQLWSSPDGDNETTKYVVPEAAADGSYYLRWYRADSSGNLSATNFYIGGISTSGQQPVCKAKDNANRFHIIQNSSGDYSFRLADVDYYGEPLYLAVKDSAMAKGTQIVSALWRKDMRGERFYLSRHDGTRITFDDETFRVYPGFDGRSAAFSDVSANGVDVALSTAPGYHAVTIDLSTAAGYAAAQKLSSLSVSTAAGKRVTLSIAAVGCFATQDEASSFGCGALAGMADMLEYDGYTVTKHWTETTEADYNANKEASKVRRYRMGNNLAFGMLLPNSGYNTASSYYAYNNFGYASRWGTDDYTVQNNLAAGKWNAYAIYEYGYAVSSTSNDGRWFVHTQGDTSYNTVSSSTANFPLTTIEGEDYIDVSKYLPNMHSYVNGMATIGLVEYELDPVTKKPVYTRETVQKLAALLQKALSISEVYDAGSATYNYNFVQGEKTLGGKDWAQTIREYLAGCGNPNVTEVAESEWSGYKSGHEALLDLSWEELTNGSHKDSFNNYLDVAYWMLNTLYYDNGISRIVPEYTHMTLSQETDSNSKTYYVFDGGYDNVAYNALDGSISHVESSGTKELVQYGTNVNAITTSRPFLPTTGSETYRQTNSPYFMDDGASTRKTGVYNTYVGRDYSYTMEGHGQFIFNMEDDLYFNFEGDDDVYLFINNKMVMDIGGAHSITNSVFNLNDYIEECGLQDGETYDFDFFYTERHTYGANIRIETNIEITSKDVITEKGATQDGVEVTNYGLVDKSKYVEYYFTLRNDGYVLPLTNLSFLDETIGFSAGYNGVSLGSYTLGGTTYARQIGSITAVLNTQDGKQINISFADTDALQTFLTDVKCEGHTEAGLAPGESLTLYGIRYGLTRDGIFKNTVYTEAGSIRGSANFAVYAGTAQQYFLWAGRPIAVSVGDAASTALGSNVGAITDFIPCSANGATSAMRPLADGVYSIGTATVISSDPSARRFVWSPKSDGELQVYDTNELYSDGTEGNEPLFYVKYAGNGYYTILNLQYNQYVYIDQTSGTDGRSQSNATDYDDRLKLVSMTEAEAAANETTLWRIEKNTTGIAPSSTKNAYVIRPKTNTAYAVDLDSAHAYNGGKVHLWTVSDSGNAAWYFNAHANGDGNMTAFSDNILVLNGDKPGTHTQYFNAVYTDGAVTVTTKVPVVLHVLDVKDNTYVLDYGLPVDLNNENDGGLTNNDLIALTGITTNTTLEGIITGEGYDSLAQIRKDAKLTSKTNGVTGTTLNEQHSTYGTFTTDNGESGATRRAYRILLGDNQNYVLSINDAASGDWSDTKPSGYDDSQLETRTMYRYRDTTTTTTTQTGTVQYANFPSGFDTSNSLYSKYHKSLMSGDGVTSTTTTVGYIYWHWCRNVALGSPYYREMHTTYTASGGYTTFHAWENANYATSISGGEKVTRYAPWMDTALDVVAFGDPGSSSTGPCANSASKSYCTDSFCWYAFPIYQQNWTKTTTTSSTSDWSDWSTAAATASSTREVQTKTQYRVKTDIVSTSGTAAVVQTRDDSNSAQLWYMDQQSDGSYVIENVASGMTLQLASTAANNVRVVQKEKTGTDAEKWVLTALSDGTNALKPFAAQAFCLDLKDGVQSQNQPIQIWQNTTPNQNQRWILSDIAQSDTYSRLVFTPEKIMNGASATKVVIRVSDSTKTPSAGLGNVDVHKEVEMYEKIVTVPASVVYYEDNFGGLDYSKTDSKIDQIGNGDGDYQDADQNEQYGHDGHYENEGHHTSGGSVTKITVTADEQVFSFSFHGTGFEIVSRATSNCSANIIASVFNTAGEEIRTIPVITEYDNGNDDDGEETIYQVPVVSVNDLKPDDYTVKVSVTSRQNYEGWTVEYLTYADGVIRYQLTAADGTVYYKLYNVATGSSTYQKEDGTETTNPMLVESYLYVDGIRIFNPLQQEQNNDPDGYYTPSESNAKILQIHDQIVGGKILVAEADETSVTVGSATATFTENRNGNIISGNLADSVEDYALVGPNNEVYLNGLSLRQALAFYVKPDENTPLAERTLQIGVRAIDEAAAGGFTEAELEKHEGKLTLSQSNATGEALAWTQITELTSGTEQYYLIDPTLCAYDEAMGAYLVLLLPRNGLVSFTGLKIKGYALVQPEAWQAGKITFGEDGKLTDASIALVNQMLQDFAKQIDSRKTVEARSTLDNRIDITLETPKDPENPKGPENPENPENPRGPENPEGPENPKEPVTPAPFDDIRGTWFEEAVNSLYASGVVKGYPDDRFHGEERLTREQFAAMLVRALELTDTGEKRGFDDTKGRWSEQEIRIAAQHGLVNGMTETTFGPELEITRQEMMVMIARALHASDAKLPTPADLSKYGDAGLIPDWALDSVKLLVATGMINGKSETELAPFDRCTRAEAAAVIYRLLEFVAKN